MSAIRKPRSWPIGLIASALSVAACTDPRADQPRPVIDETGATEPKHGSTNVERDLERFAKELTLRVPEAERPALSNESDPRTPQAEVVEAATEIVAAHSLVVALTALPFATIAEPVSSRPEMHE